MTNSDVSSSHSVHEIIVTGTSTQSDYAIEIPAGKRDTNQPANKVQSAVYSHIRALRALGKTSVNTAEIAEALNISQKAVIRAVRELSDKGVKVAG